MMGNLTVGYAIKLHNFMHAISKTFMEMQCIYGS